MESAHRVGNADVVPTRASLKHAKELVTSRAGRRESTTNLSSLDVVPYALYWGRLALMKRRKFQTSE
jgi:hypothetical protein